MNKVAFYTLGCKVNQYETEAMAQLFKKEGYSICSFDEPADVYVINTCTVTNIGDRKSRQIIRRARRQNPDAVIAVTGCYAQVSPEDVMKIEGVNVIVGTKDRAKIVRLVQEAKGNGTVCAVSKDIMSVREFEELDLDEYSDSKERTRAFIKIQDGCNNFCTYCIIPYARGPVRSRGMDKIISEAERLVKRGYLEIVLTGIHICSYGKDLGDVGLIDVLEEIDSISGLKRIRLGSLEPLSLTEDFIRRIARLEKLCHHFHISLQSGSESVLRRMNRKYTPEQYMQVLSQIRSVFPDAAITTDIITGFPGETEEEFEETLRFVERARFSNMHIFPYSPRKGTVAAKMSGQVMPALREKRAHVLSELGNKLRSEYIASFVGKTEEVLFERRIEGGYFEGLTDKYFRVLAKSNADIENKILQVRLVKSFGDHALGEI